MTSKQTEETHWTISPHDAQTFCGEHRQKINEVTKPLAELLAKLDRAKLDADGTLIAELKSQATECHKQILNVAGEARKQALAFEEGMNPEINKWPAILDQEETTERVAQEKLIREHQAALAMSNKRIERVQQRRSELFADYQSSTQLLQALLNELLAIIATSAEAV